VQRINWGITYWSLLRSCFEPVTDNREKAGLDLAATKISGKFFNARSAAQRVKGRRPGIVTQKSQNSGFKNPKYISQQAQ
jgi:hypothetical protein